MPAPTNGTMVHQGEEEDDHTDEREQWLESLHRAAPGTNWRMMEYQNRMRRHRERAGLLQMRSDCGFEPIANGLLQGRWSERAASIKRAVPVDGISRRLGHLLRLSRAILPDRLL